MNESSSIWDESVHSRAILIHGISNLSSDILELFFENKNKSGGDDIESIEIDEGADEALIIYCCPAVACRVLERGPSFKIGSRTVSTECPPKPDPHSILIRGIPEMVSLEYLELFFENKKRSSGGDIRNVEYEEGSGEAIISFEDVEVARQVLLREDLMLAGSPLTASSLTLKHLKMMNSESGGNNRRIVHVSGIPSNIDKETLELWLKSKAAGGGEVESLHLDSKNGTATVTFANEEDAEKLLERKTLRINEVDLTIEKRTPSQLSMKGRRGHDSVDHLKGVHTIEVVNVPEISKHYLKLALENQSRGKVDHIVMNPENSTAVVRFRDCTDVLRVLQKRTVTLEDTECPLVPLYTKVHDRFEGSMAIVVTGFNENITEELLEMYFGNQRISGGYDIRSILLNKEQEKAVITYQTAEAVKSILDMQDKQGLSLKDTVFIVKEMEPLPPPPLVKEPTEPDKLIMVRAPPVTKGDLESFLSQTFQGRNYSDDDIKVAIKNVMYAWKKDTLLIEFAAKPDYDALLTVCASLPLEDRMVSLQRVPLPRMIQVRLEEDTDIEDLELYFESKRSGGGSIKGEIRIYEKERCAVIDYDDCDVVKSVLQKRHIVENKAVTVAPFYPAFGICPFDYDPTQPWHIVPEPFKYGIDNSCIGRFLLTHPSGQKLLNDIGVENAFDLIKENTTDTELCICYKANAAGKAPDKKIWERRCRESLDRLCSSILSETVSCPSECYDKALAEGRRSTVDDSILVDSSKDQSLITLTGWEAAVRHAVNRINVYIQELHEELIRQNESVQERIDCNQPAVDIMKAKCLERELNEKSPKLIVKFMADGISLTGLPNEVTSAKLFIYEILLQIKSLPWVCSPSKLILIQRQSVRSFVASKFQKVNIAVSWEPQNAQLIIYALSEKELLAGRRIIDKAIKERVIGLHKKTLEALALPGWTQLKQRLHENYGDDYLVDEDARNLRIVVATTSDKHDAMTKAIEKYIAENTDFGRADRIGKAPGKSR